MLDPFSQKSKGYTIKGALNFVVHKFGKDKFEKLLEKISPELKNEIKKGIIPSDWYPFKFQVEVYEAIDLTLGTGNLQICKEIGRYTAEYEISTIHKLFLKIGSIDTIFKFGSLLWGRYYNKGKLEIKIEGKGKGEACIKEWHPISKAFCIDLLGWMERTLELSGADSVHIKHSDCILDGAPYCKFEGVWKQ